MIRIFVDTMFLMMPFQFKVDIFSELDRLFGNYEACISSITFKELDNIESKASKGADKSAVKAVRKLIEQKNLTVIESNEKLVDDFLVENAEDFDFIATQDKELKKKLKNRTKFIVLRSGKYLENVL